jgi:hypothetical protein
MVLMDIYQYETSGITCKKKIASHEPNKIIAKMRIN